MSKLSGLEVTKDKLDRLIYDARYLTTQDVLVGIPSSNAGRRDTPESNAVIGYVQEFGSPAHNIPPRPFLTPGIRSVQDKITVLLQRAGVAQFDKGEKESEKFLKAMGVIATNAVKKKITDGPFTPLAESTIRARAARGRKGAKAELAALAKGAKPSEYLLRGNIRPLVDTGQLRQAITYVIRKR